MLLPEPRVRRLRHLELRRPESVRVFRIVGRQFRHMAVGVRDAYPIVEPLTDGGQLQVGVHLARHQANGALERRAGVAVPAERDQARAGKQPRWPIRRIDARRGVELHERLLVAPALLQHDREIVVDRRDIAAVPEDAAKHVFRRRRDFPP